MITKIFRGKIKGNFGRDSKIIELKYNNFKELYYTLLEEVKEDDNYIFVKNTLENNKALLEKHYNGKYSRFPKDFFFFEIISASLSSFEKDAREKELLCWGNWIYKIQDKEYYGRSFLFRDKNIFELGVWDKDEEKGKDIIINTKDESIIEIC